MKSFKSIVRYSNSDDYSHPIFVSTNEIHTQSYNTLVRLAEKLNADYPDTYRNVYRSDTDVVYIKTSTFRGDSLWSGGLYEIEWVPVQKSNNNKEYVIIKLLNLKRIQEDLDTVYDF